MVKLVIALIFLCSFFACRQREKQFATKKIQITKNDTFERVFESHLQIPDDMYLDTIITYNKKVNGTTTVIWPRLKNKAFDQVDKLLINEIERRLDGDTTMEKTDHLKEVFDWQETTEPVNIYKSDKLISYGFLITSSDAHSMRPFRRYISVNFDISKNKIQHFDDYFNIVTKADTLSLCYFIYSAVEENDSAYNSNWREYGYDNSFDFSVDNDKVYFYFDEFTVGGNPYGLEGSVKKKYISRLIRNEYQ